MRAAAALSHRKVPIRLMWITLVKNSPAMGPFLPSTRPAPITPAQFTSRLRPARRDCAPSEAEVKAATARAHSRLPGLNLPVNSAGVLRAGRALGTNAPLAGDLSHKVSHTHLC